MKAGTSSFLQYRNHIETCYCISGKGTSATPPLVRSILLSRARCTHWTRTIPTT
nr:hypothetical protein [Sinorhizobium sp. 8-89]